MALSKLCRYLFMYDEESQWVMYQVLPFLPFREVYSIMMKGMIQDLHKVA